MANCAMSNRKWHDLTAALSFKKGFSTRTLSEFGREPLLLVLKFQLNPGHPRFQGLEPTFRFSD